MQKYDIEKIQNTSIFGIKINIKSLIFNYINFKKA
jgi:hypothetical protein